MTSHSCQCIGVRHTRLCKNQARWRCSVCGRTFCGGCKNNCHGHATESATYTDLKDES